MAGRRTRGALAIAEVVRLAIVLALTAAGFALGGDLADLLGREDVEATRLVASVLGALTGYLAGGVIGRTSLRRVDAAERTL